MFSLLLCELVPGTRRRRASRQPADRVWTTASLCATLARTTVVRPGSDWRESRPSFRRIEMGVGLALCSSCQSSAWLPGSPTPALIRVIRESTSGTTSFSVKKNQLLRVDLPVPNSTGELMAAAQPRCAAVVRTAVGLWLRWARWTGGSHGLTPTSGSASMETPGTSSVSPDIRSRGGRTSCRRMAVAAHTAGSRQTIRRRRPSAGSCARSPPAPWRRHRDRWSRRRCA
jgi:hypothetical protein